MNESFIFNEQKFLKKIYSYRKERGGNIKILKASYTKHAAVVYMQGGTRDVLGISNGDSWLKFYEIWEVLRNPETFKLIFGDYEKMLCVSNGMIYDTISNLKKRGKISSEIESLIGEFKASNKTKQRRVKSINLTNFY